MKDTARQLQSGLGIQCSRIYLHEFTDRDASADARHGSKKRGIGYFAPVSVRQIWAIISLFRLFSEFSRL